MNLSYVDVTSMTIAETESALHADLPLLSGAAGLTLTLTLTRLTLTTSLLSAVVQGTFTAPLRKNATLVNEV